MNNIINLLEAAIDKRKCLKDCTNAMRLVNGFADNLGGLILEQYDRHYCLHISDKRWIAERKILTDFIRQRCQAAYLIVKDRSDSPSARPQDIKNTVWIEYHTSKTVVSENDLKFSVDLNDTLNSGLFLDMRHNRKLIADKAAGRKILNCFSYTCSFGVYCRHANAVSVVNVDISRKNLERGRTNYELNQIIPERNEFIRADAVGYLEKAVKKGNSFDMIIIDPPSFARNENKTFSVRKDLVKIVDSAVNVLNPKGIIFVATNFTEISSSSLEEMIRDVAGRRKIANVQHLRQDIDFTSAKSTPESYLAAVLVEM
jgi:23S rRNA (cytosine1962-C5)-methyltransferase